MVLLHSIVHPPSRCHKLPLYSLPKSWCPTPLRNPRCIPPHPATSHFLRKAQHNPQWTRMTKWRWNTLPRNSVLLKVAPQFTLGTTPKRGLSSRSDAWLVRSWGWRWQSRWRSLGREGFFAYVANLMFLRKHCCRSRKHSAWDSMEEVHRTIKPCDVSFQINLRFSLCYLFVAESCRNIFYYKIIVVHSWLWFFFEFYDLPV